MPDEPRPLLGYASVTSGDLLESIIDAGWGILFSASYCIDGFGPQRRRYMKSPPSPYCIDNGAWSQAGGDIFDAFKFMRLVGMLGERAEFIILPDIVGGGHASLERSVRWIRPLEQHCRRLLIPAQNGLVPADLMPYLGPNVGVFLGGSTAYKLRTMATWGAAAVEAECYYHVGRVNTAKRIAMCGRYSADSFDGSGVSKFGMVAHSGTYLPKLEAARAEAVARRTGIDTRQPDMFEETR